MFRPEKIIVHHSATKDSGTVSWGAIRRYHMETNGWSDIGYHAGVELVGDQYEVMLGRALDVPGAHTVGQNFRSLGVCFVGDFDAQEPTQKLLEVAAFRVLAPWCKKFDIPIDAIVGHRDFAPKTCPGKLFSIERLREAVRKELDKLV